MQSLRNVILVFIALLLFTSLACGLPFGDTAESVPPAVESAKEAVQGAGSVAQTAASQAGDLPGTAAALATTEGSDLIATVKAAATTEGSELIAAAKAAATPHADLLKEKLESIEPDADGNYRVSLGEDELNTVLRLRQLLTGDIMGAAIQSQEVQLRDGNITLTGSILEPLPGQLRVGMRPTVVEGQLQLNIEEATVADQEAPQEAIEAAEGAVTGSLGEALEHLPVGVQLQEITAADDELTIIGVKD